MQAPETGPSIPAKLHYAPSDISAELTALHREKLEAAFAGVAAGDGGAFWALFDPEVVFYEAACLPYGGAHHGIEATRKAHAIIHDCFDSVRVDVERLFVEGDLAIAYLQLGFRVRRNGRTGALPLAELYRFRDGRIVEWRALYFDSNLVAEAINADA